MVTHFVFERHADEKKPAQGGPKNECINRSRNQALRVRGAAVSRPRDVFETH